MKLQWRTKFAEAVANLRSRSNMSASETLKTRSGIKRFLLPNGDEEDVVLAFDYLDRKTEVHLLKQDCTPLYLEENSKVSVLNFEPNRAFLLVATPNVKQGKGFLIFRLWDLSSVLGFTPKEIQITDNERQVVQDGKFRCQLTFNEVISDTSAIKLDSLNSHVALQVENEILLGKAAKKDSSALILQWFNRIKLKACQFDNAMTLLQVKGEYSLVVGEGGCLTVWSLDGSDALVSRALPILAKPSGALQTPQKFCRASKSMLVFTDDHGNLWLYSLLMNMIQSINLPGLQNGCHTFSITNQKPKNNIVVAVCSDAHTVYMYNFAGDRPRDPTFICERPFKILFSVAPVDALGFVKRGILALASSSNRTLTLWTVNTPS